MRGWRSGMIIGVGIVFILTGGSAALALDDSGSPYWAIILAIIFCGGGSVAIFYGLYAHSCGVGYGLEIRDDVIQWGRSDVPKIAGKISLSNIREIIHTSYPEEDSLHAVDFSGVRHNIPIAYMGEVNSALKLVNFIQKCYPKIQIKNRTS